MKGFSHDGALDGSSVERLEDPLAEPSQDDVFQFRLLREAWGMAETGPLLVVGRLTGWLRDSLPGMFFLDDLSHPDTGDRLVYPKVSGSASTRAYVPPDALKSLLSPEKAVAGDQWAMAELQLSPEHARAQRRNPQECSVRSGSVRLLTGLPLHWKVQIHGTPTGLQIAEQARAAIAAELKSAEETAAARRKDLAKQIDSDERRALEVKDELGSLQEQRRIESVQLADARRAAERETADMRERYQKLAQLLTDKGQRLVALGLIDDTDLATLLPSEQAGPTKQGLSFTDTFGGEFSRLAPWLQARLAKGGLLYPQGQVRNFLALLRTRDLVVLAGDSGSGKTSMVRAVAGAVGGVCTVIPVKPNWTGPEDLLGYYNPIERAYHPTPFLLALQAAARAPDVPHFICLDEMNLARVEHYFADFLSLLEDRTSSPEIHLYTSDEERHLVAEQGVFLELEAEARRRAEMGEDAAFEDLLKDDQANAALQQLGGFRETEGLLSYHSHLRRALAAHMRTPTSLRFPDNVWIFGAVNMDETTHHLSPKVLDRVHVLRFGNPMLADWDAIEDELAAVDVQDVELAMTTNELGQRNAYPDLDLKSPDMSYLARLAREFLDPLGIEFGLRAIRQTQGYFVAAREAGLDHDVALNNAILQKILPKVTLDTSRSSADGRSRRDVLLALRGALAERLGNSETVPEDESAVARLDRTISLADGNHGVANYWMR